MEYFIVIIAATFLTSIAEKCLNKHKIIFMVISVFSLIFPVYLAGARDVSVGTDVRVYLMKEFEWAQRSESIISYCISMGDYVGFTVFVFIATKIFNSFPVIMGTIEAVICVLFYLTAYKNRKRVPMWIFMLTFYCTLYIYSFNIMKQSISLAVVAFGMSYFEKKEWAKWFFSLFIAILFHPSSFVVVFLLPLIPKKEFLPSTIHYEGIKNRETKILTRIIIIETILIGITCASAFFSITYILQILSKGGLFARQATTYLEFGIRPSIQFEMYKIVINLFWIVMIWRFRNLFLVREFNNYLILLMFILGLGGIILGGRIEFFERIALPFNIYAMCVGCGQMGAYLKIRIGKIDVSFLWIAVVLLFCCWWQFVVCNQAAAYPYKFG